MRRLAVSIVAFLSLLPLPAARAQTITWTDQFGTRKHDEAWGLLATGTDVYVAGETAGRLDGSSQGGFDGFLRRYSSDGTLVWSVGLGTTGTDRTFGVAMDATGLYVVGQTDVERTDRDPADGFLAKFDTDGNQLWFQTFGTSRNDFPSYLVADGTAAYVVGATTGRFEGQERAGGQDVFLARFDQDGTNEWTVQFGSRSSDSGYADAVTPFGILLSGWTGGNLGTRHRDYDAFAALYDTDGNRVWLRQFGTRDSDFGYGLESDATGVYVSGQTFGAFRGSEPAGALGGSDSFVRKLDPTDGSRIWVRQFGTPRSDYADALVVHGDEVIAGGTAESHFADQTAAGRGDAYVHSLEAATGEDRWTLQFGSTERDAVNWLAVAGDALYAVGSVGAALPGETSFGDADAFVASFALEGAGP